jgi:hypothetical protein
VLSEAEQTVQGFPRLSPLGLSPWLLLLGGGFSPFGWTTTLVSSLGGRLSPCLWAFTPIGSKQAIANAANANFFFKSNIEFSNPPHAFIKRAWEGELRDAPASFEQ